jgi:hypothetical protein
VFIAVLEFALVFKAIIVDDLSRPMEQTVFPIPAVRLSRHESHNARKPAPVFEFTRILISIRIFLNAAFFHAFCIKSTEVSVPIFIFQSSLRSFAIFIGPFEFCESHAFFIIFRRALCILKSTIAVELTTFPLTLVDITIFKLQ